MWFTAKVSHQLSSEVVIVRLLVLRQDRTLKEAKIITARYDLFYLYRVSIQDLLSIYV